MKSLRRLSKSDAKGLAEAEGEVAVGKLLQSGCKAGGGFCHLCRAQAVALGGALPLRLAGAADTFGFLLQLAGADAVLLEDIDRDSHAADFVTPVCTGHLGGKIACRKACHPRGQGLDRRDHPGADGKEACNHDSKKSRKHGTHGQECCLVRRSGQRSAFLVGAIDRLVRLGCEAGSQFLESRRAVLHECCLNCDNVRGSCHGVATSLDNGCARLVDDFETPGPQLLHTFVARLDCDNDLHVFDEIGSLSRDLLFCVLVAFRRGRNQEFADGCTGPLQRTVCTCKIKTSPRLAFDQVAIPAVDSEHFPAGIGRNAQGEGAEDRHNCQEFADDGNIAH